MSVDVGDLLEFLDESEQRELDEHLAHIAAATGPDPDVAYQRDPIGWARDVLGIPERLIRWSQFSQYQFHTWDGTPDPLAVIAESLANGEHVGVESATGTGKTYWAAVLALWFFACFRDAIVVTTAPKKDALTKLLWKEIGRHWPKFSRRYPHARKIELTARMKPGSDEQETWAIVGQVAGVGAGEESATKIQGFHAEHLLAITEETPGMHPASMNAIWNTLTADHNLQLSLGNPDSQFDELHQFCMRPGVRHVIISALDHPNVVLNKAVIPGATSRKGIANIASKHAPGSPMYDSRVRGRSPEQAAEALIQLAWLREAVARANERGPITGTQALGIDPSNSENGDKAAIARFVRNRLMPIEEFPCPDANQLGRDVFEKYLDASKVAIPLRHEHVGVDNVGVGAGTLNELRAKAGVMIQALNGGAAPVTGAQRAPDGSPYEWIDDANAYRNLRTQMYWQFREDLRLGVVEIEEEDAELFAELTNIKCVRKGGVIIVEAKEQIRKKIGHSPNKADAAVYANWVRPRERIESVVASARAQNRDPDAVVQLPQKHQPELVERDPAAVGGAESQFGEGWW